MEGGRFVGVAVDFSACSKKALKWAIDNILRKGDHLILVTVRPEGHYEEGEMQLWEATGSPLIPLSEFCDAHTMKKYGVNPDPETLDMVTLAARQKEVIITISGVSRAIMVSVSNYVVNNATCPVTVVKHADD